MLRKASNVEPLADNLRQRKVLIRVWEMTNSLPAIIQGCINLEAQDSKYASEDTC